MARVLGVIRLSKETDESTSSDRQRAQIQQWADARGHEVVGWAEDLNTSGSVAPWQREGLGHWLPSTIGKDATWDERRAATDASRAREWDILCSWKLDRISRSTLHTWQLHEWCKANDKQLASVNDGFDLTTAAGEFLFNILSSFAQMELDTIRFRAKDSFNELVRKGRWRGGWLPYGYRARPGPDGGFYLVVDDDGLNTAGVLREIVDRVIDGQSINSVCHWLNTEGFPSPLDAQRIRAGKEPEGAKWRVGNLTKILRSHTLLGWTEVGKTVEGPDGVRRRETRLVYGDDGRPLQRAEPVIERETFDRLQQVIDERATPRRAAEARKDRSMLLGIAECECGTQLYTYRGRSHSYYRCGLRSIAGVKCIRDAKGIRQDDLEELIVDIFLERVGHLEIVERTYRPGEDYTLDVGDAERALDALEADRRAGLYDGAYALSRYQQQHRALVERVEELRSLPSRPGVWQEVPTGVTYRQRWAKLTTPQDRNAELRAASVKAVVHRDEFSEGEQMFISLANVAWDEDGNELPPEVREELGLGPSYAGIRRGRVEVRLPSELEDRILHHAARKDAER